MLLLRVPGCVVFFSVEEANSIRPVSDAGQHPGAECGKCTAAVYGFTDARGFPFSGSLRYLFCTGGRVPEFEPADSNDMHVARGTVS